MQMNELESFATSSDPLLACSLCRRLLQEAVLLKCLHNCCRQCFLTAAVEDGCRGEVRCNTCGAVTKVGSELVNGFIECQVKRYEMISESMACDKCIENGEHDKPALVWCPLCRHSLCEDCMAVHRQYYRHHLTQYFEELRSPDDVHLHSSAAACGIHGNPLDIVCLNCEKAKCTSCWTNCKEKKHDVHVVSDVSFDRYVGSLVASISSIESELLRKSEVLEKAKSVHRDTKAARDRHLKDLMQRKRRVMDAVENAYERIAQCTKDAYDDIAAEGAATVLAAERIASDLSDAQSYIRRLVDSKEKCEVFKQQRMLRERLSVLSAALDRLSDRLATSEVKIDTSLPENVEDVVQAWIGIPRKSSASEQTLALQEQQQQQQSYSFGAASASFKLPVNCWDVALTKDGCRLLLAALQHGLIELSSSCGHELSSWRPPKHSSSISSSQDEWVLSVAAVDDGRAAVSLHYAQCVVLLRRSDTGGSITGGAAVPAAAGDDAWTEDRIDAAEAAAGAWSEDRRLDALSWPARFLSAHGDVLAASECRLNKQTNRRQPGQRLQLLSLGSGRRLSAELQREYDIHSLAVAADMIVTGSWEKVELGDGRGASDVLDAHSVTGDVRLWRREMNSSSSDSEKEEEWLLAGICLDSSGGCLYAAMWRSDRSSGRVTALSLADGSELRRVALSFTSAAAAAAQPQLLLVPRQLSLCEDVAASAAAAEQQQQQSSGRRMLLLAALCWDATTTEWRTVTLHRSTRDVLQ